MRLAVQVERLEFRRGEDFANGDLASRSRQRVAALCAARARDDPGSSQPEQDLLDVIRGKFFARGKIAAGDRPLVGALGEVQRADHTVLGPGSNAHTAE